LADLAPAPRPVTDRRHLVVLAVVLDGPIVAVVGSGLAAVALLAREAWRWRRKLARWVRRPD
jgi:hypothetical protein